MALTRTDILEDEVNWGTVPVCKLPRCAVPPRHVRTNTRLYFFGPLFLFFLAGCQQGTRESLLHGSQASRVRRYCRATGLPVKWLPISQTKASMLGAPWGLALALNTSSSRRSAAGQSGRGCGTVLPPTQALQSVVDGHVPGPGAAFLCLTNAICQEQKQIDGSVLSSLPLDEQNRFEGSAHKQRKRQIRFSFSSLLLLGRLLPIWLALPDTERLRTPCAPSMSRTGKALGTGTCPTVSVAGAGAG
ncbi:hypothetical protein DIPPA_22137 [Diplonema papillatum]|nr:hypothetical protein DIPPA_22137 [Diplonema papillatum]